MSTALSLLMNSLIGQTAYFTTTGIFFGIAVIAAAARAFIRIYYFKRIKADDYFFFIAIAALIAAQGLFSVSIGIVYNLYLISEGKALPPPDLIQQIDNASTYTESAVVLSWTTIYSIKLCFLFHFRTLVNRLYKMEAWWWFTLAVLVPTTAFGVLGTFISCPHMGSSLLLNCVAGPGFARRERDLVYYAVVADSVTDVMLISIPVLVLHKSSFNLRRKLSIAVVLCLSLIMIVINLIRGISAGIRGTEDQVWNSFWLQLEASISVITACPAAFRSLFLINQSKNTPEEDNRDQRSALERLWRKTKPSLQSIRVGATLTGMRSLIGDNEKTQLESQDDENDLSSAMAQRLDPSPSLEAPKESAEATHLAHEPAQAMV